jgi:hypothetical protein
LGFLGFLLAVSSLSHQIYAPEMLGMDDEDEIIEFSEDPMEGHLIWSGISV